MTRALFSSVFCILVHALAVDVALADENDPVQWTERCFDSSKDQLDWASKNQQCIQIILGYCQFASDSRSCFQKLTDNYETRANEFMDRLPNSLDAASPQKQFFNTRLDLLNSLSIEDQCVGADKGSECAAFVSIGRYLGALSLIEWLEKREESK